ncbi:hypothetical protein HU200_011552 [Digitaria exilis]|uniref:Uncharacterized protein n=1 Tax=Digitaria exilis TaxID=1010633 RepID=A0A835KML7_9POAL|nr:hypothetical protein HU200_011552 [Digitaria exilis]
MEIITGALPSVITKLTDLATGEYNLQKGLKNDIKFLQEELMAMKGALEDISKVPPHQLPNGDDIWATNVRDLSYDIEDSIVEFMVQFDVRKLDNQHGLKDVIDRSLDWSMQLKIRHKIATEIKEIKSRVLEVHERHRRYEVNQGINKPITATVDPRLFCQYTKMTELVGIDEARDDLINTMMEGNEVPMQKAKIVSIVGFGGLGKTTLANAVYQKLRVQFDCWAFVPVSQTPDLKKIFKGLLYHLGKNYINDEALDEGWLIEVLRESLQEKRYFFVIDDIWDIEVWKVIKCALPHNDVGSMIITTTRNRDVAEQVGGAYQMKPLSLKNSQKLLYGRIFGNGYKDNNEDTDKQEDDLAEVSNQILMTIITIGSLLASKGANKMDWDEVYNSMGTGLHNNFDVGTMRKILLLSYYDLPSHLKTCLLYLSVFPEDFKIERDRLIWMWVAEDFIQCTREGKSLSEIGESYFNELINRSMIQLVNYEYDLDDTSPTNTVRRLSLQNWKVDHARIGGKTKKQKIRSVVVFSPLNPEPKLWTFGILRVLDLESCRLYKVHFCLKHLGKLTHLRYLGLRTTFIEHIPNEEIRKLRFLQTLDIRHTLTMIGNFSLAVYQLKHLRCLHIQNYGGVPRGISNLTSLEVLSIMLVGDSTTIIELGHLTELRVLKISLNSGYTVGLENSLVECLQKLKKINTVDIRGTDLLDRIGLLDAWQAPPHLRRIQLSKCWFSVRPDWMNPSHLRRLTFLAVSVLRLQQEDLAIIGRLPALRDLCLCVDYGLGIVVNGSLFPNLIRCKLLNFMPPVVFHQGAMPMLTDLEFTFDLRKTRRITGSIDSLEFGLENLRALQNIVVRFGDESDREHDTEEAMAVLRNAVEIHPNRPKLERDDRGLKHLYECESSFLDPPPLSF